LAAASQLTGSHRLSISKCNAHALGRYGVVSSEAQPASEFMTPEGLLFERQLIEPRFKRIGESEDHAEHVVGIAWRKTV